MWILVLVLFQPWSSVPTSYHLFTYDKQYKLCLSEEERIMNEMIAAYPTDNDFLIKCRWKEATWNGVSKPSGEPSAALPH